MAPKSVNTQFSKMIPVPSVEFRTGNNVTSRGPILLHHGILLDSTSWVSNLPHQSLGFVLADAGFDVWLGNARGNIHSMRHQVSNRLRNVYSYSITSVLVQYLVPVMDSLFHYLMASLLNIPETPI